MNKNVLPLQIILTLLLFNSACNPSSISNIPPNSTVTASVPANTPEPEMSEAITFSTYFGNPDIYLAEGYNTDPVQLTSSPENAAYPVSNQSPVFSPDGTRIAFSSDRDSAGHGANIFVMDRDGSNVFRLTNDTCGSAPAWSPDGKHIAFVSCSKPIGDISLVTADGTDITVLTHIGIVEYIRPIWSPDGRYLVFIGLNPAGTNSLYIMDADGSNVTRLEQTTTSIGISANSPAWSPDGTLIAYLATESIANGGRSQILLLDVNQPTAPSLISGQGQKLSSLVSLVWSRDGNQLMVLSNLDGLHVMTADGANITNPTGNNPALFKAIFVGNSIDWFTPGVRPHAIAVQRPVSGPNYDQLVAQLKGICAGGVALPQQPAYMAGNGPHPIAAFRPGSNGNDWENADYPGLRLPPYSMDAIQLIACIRGTSELVEACKYVSDTGVIVRTLKRSIHHSIAEVVEARTGIVVDNFDLVGSGPQPCPPSIGQYDSSPNLDGSSVGVERIYLELDDLYFEK